jgi:hypothetical protein
MGIGFELSESCAGSFYLLERPFEDRPIRCSLRLRVDGMRRFLRERRIAIEGVLFADGLAASGRDVAGSLVWKLLDEKRVPYDLAFQGDDGRPYHLRGQRAFFVHDAAGSLTTLPASLYDDRDAEIGRAMLRFDPRTELPELLRSFRPRLRSHRDGG